MGNSDDCRIPDGGVLRARSDAIYCDSAALVVEVLSPSDETVAKLPFYAEHAVDEVVIIDPPNRAVSWLRCDAPTAWTRTGVRWSHSGPAT